MSNVSDTSSSPPSDPLWQPVTVKWFLVVFGCCLGYAILRYHIASAEPWSHFPLYILNKATSLAAVVFVACSYLIGRVIRWHADGKHLEEHPEEQATVARARELRAEGKSLRAIGRALLDEGRRPRKGKRWHVQVVKRMTA